MKSFYYIFCFLFLFVACKTEAPKPDSSEKPKGPFKVRTEPMPNRMITKYELLHPEFEGSILNELHLNKTGNMQRFIEFDIYDQGKESLVIDYKYDRKKRLKEKIWTKDEGQKIYNHRYNKKGLLRQKTTLEDDVKIANIFYEYSDKGWLQKERFEDGEGNEKSSFIYEQEFNAQDSIVLEKKIKKAGNSEELIYQISYEYNKENQRVRKLSFNAQGQIKERCIYNYAPSNKTLTEIFCFDELNQTENYSILRFYNQYGERVREDYSISSYEGDSLQIEYRNFWEYDEWGQEIGFWFEYAGSSNYGGEKTVYTIFED